MTKTRSLLVALALPLGGCFGFPFGGGSSGGDGNSGYCSCPAPTSECEVSVCVDGECQAEYLLGAPALQQDAGDCVALICTGSRNAIALPDASDIPDDDNPCTVDTCADDGPHHEALPAGSSCGDGGKCTPAGECLVCDDDNPCTTEDCSSGTLVVTHTQAPGSSCGDGQVCSTAGQCIACSDDNPCTTEDCSSGAVVETGNLPAGASCGDGLVCTADAVCIGCDDGNACTLDDCSTGVPVYTTEPNGTPCSDGGGSGTCDNAICVTWCQPLPDPTTCPDNGAYEIGGADNTVSGGPQFPDDDGAPKGICGVVTGTDTDWISYYAEDRSFENDINDFMIWSFEQPVRFCAYAECTVGTTSTPCYDGGVPSTGPQGEPGCCWTQVFNTLSYVSMNLFCDGTSDDSGWVHMRVDDPNGVACLPYAVLDYGY